MKFPVLLAAVAGATGVAGDMFSPHQKLPARYRQQALQKAAASQNQTVAEPAYLTAKSKPYSVDGSKIPQVDFNIGESYAGTLPISTNKTDENRLYFWFFPSQNPLAKDEITIWLNGGPGCSSLLGLLQENGPFLWQPGTYAPKANPYSWTNLTNIVYVDSPIGTGFSPAAKGAPKKIVNEDIVAEDFLAFWKNFVDTFDLHGRKVYVTGESYAGMYVPYISYHMLQANNTQYFNVKGMQINDPSINYDDTLEGAPAVMMVNKFNDFFGLNDTFVKQLNQRADACGYTAFMNNALTFPPKGKLPTAPNGYRKGCQLWSDINEAVGYVNPCFNVYHISDFCPFLWNVVGFPGLGWGPNNYFNQTAVKKAINAPLNIGWEACGDPDLGLNYGDKSIPSALGPIPHIIEKTNNVIIGHGELDFILLANGTLATIQNMTWNGLQGFQKAPSDNFYVPYHPGLFEIIEGGPGVDVWQTNVAGAGYLGTTHTERGLTFVTVQRSGHEIPQYQPGAAYRQLEFLLGRIKSLTEVSDFTTQNGSYTGTGKIY